MLDRYVESNMAFQGCKMNEKKERLNFFKFINNLEYKMLGIPRPNISILLFMPTSASAKLKKNRVEKPDQNEEDEEYLKRAEQTYLEIAKLNKFKIIECTDGERIKSIPEIQENLFEFIKNHFSKDFNLI